MVAEAGLRRKGGAVMRVAVLVACVVGISGCAAPPGACLLPGQTRMVQVELYFGRDVAGRAPVSEAEWADFARTDITPHFPDGFTVIDARGQWLNPRMQRIGGEATKLVQIVAPDGKKTAAGVAAISQAYRVRFRQEAVGVTSVRVCGAF
jgi:hypothetical protein